jgi:hypothetical protein
MGQFTESNPNTIIKHNPSKSHLSIEIPNTKNYFKINIRFRDPHTKHTPRGNATGQALVFWRVSEPTSIIIGDLPDLPNQDDFLF